jgi:hypothetical protein
MSKTSLLLVCCLAVAPGCISCSEVRHSVSQFSEQDITREKLQQYERSMHLTFPGSTRALNAAYESGGPDDAVFLKVEMDKQDVEAFVKNSPFANANLRSDQSPIHNRQDLPWWDPDGAKTYKAGQVILPSNGALNMQVDLDDEMKAVVYLTQGEL